MAADPRILVRPTPPESRPATPADCGWCLGAGRIYETIADPAWPAGRAGLLLIVCPNCGGGRPERG